MKKNDIVAVTFLDHVESSCGVPAERFIVYGRLVFINARELRVRSWAYESPKRKADTFNNTTYTILRSAIEKTEVLKPVKS